MNRHVEWLAIIMLVAPCCQKAMRAQICGQDSDCATDEVCINNRCQSALVDGCCFPDRDLDSFDAGELTQCETAQDCQSTQQCHNNFCVEINPPVDCLPNEADNCQNDHFCIPGQGCFPWEAEGGQLGCEHIPPEGQFTPELEWSWHQPQTASQWNQVMMTPVVVDLSGLLASDVPAVPAVLFNSFSAQEGFEKNGILRAVWGDTGQEIFSVVDEALRTHPTSNIAAGDLDGDGRVEIVTATSSGRDLICFDAYGQLRWRTTTDNLIVGWGGPAIANVDGQGPAEIVVGANVINADGSIRWRATGSSGDNYRQHASAPFSVPCDIDGDGKMEIVTGDVLYAHDGTVLWDTGFGDGFVAVAQFTASGPPEIVVVSRGSVRVQSALNGQLIWLRTAEQLNQLEACDPNCGLLGPPTIADFDGDNKPEIGIAGADVYLVLDTSGDVLWSAKTRDSSSNITGSAVFDFEGDRRAEVVYADEVSLKVLRGRDGHVLYEQPHSSLTACEYPVIADVDGDFNAEIIVAQNSLLADAPQQFNGIKVYRDAADNWVSTRRIWNQHAYHVTNINEDGSVPTLQTENWSQPALNNFRQNVQTYGLFNAPDLTIQGLGFDASGCQRKGLVVYAAINNRGSLTVGPKVPISFYLADSNQNRSLLGVVFSNSYLAPGQSEVVAYLWRDPPIDQWTTIIIVADDNGGGATPQGQHSECRESNNLGSIELICRPDA